MIHVRFAVGMAASILVLTAGLSVSYPAVSAGQRIKASGSKGFDFEFGTWRVHHRVKSSTGWVEFEGTSRARPLMDGSANVEDNTFMRPAGVTHGVALRAYDRASDLWAIWWVDSRDPHGAMDPPVKGRFDDGVGTFYADSMVAGRLTRTRFIWSKITATSAQWEQALSTDGGKSWDTNWIMEFQRVQQ